MTVRAKQLLKNLLDGLDRLFDHQSTVIDIRDLLFATCEALRNTDYSPQIEEPMPALASIVCSRATIEEQRDLALIATDQLRHFLASVLSLD